MLCQCRKYTVNIGNIEIQFYLEKYLFDWKKCKINLTLIKCLIRWPHWIAFLCVLPFLCVSGAILQCYYILVKYTRTYNNTKYIYIFKCWINMICRWLLTSYVARVQIWGNNEAPGNFLIFYQQFTSPNLGYSKWHPLKNVCFY